jgi:hypothetical protein
MGHSEKPITIAQNYAMVFKSLGGVGLNNTVYIHTLFRHHCPFKGYGKLLKTIA